MGLGTVSWYRSNYGSDVDNSEIAVPVTSFVEFGWE